MSSSVVSSSRNKIKYFQNFFSRAKILCFSSPHPDRTCSPYRFNDESKKFGNRLSDSLKKINNKYILYSQEDFILYDNVEEDRFYSLLNFLDNSDFSFLRLMKSGINEGNPGKLLDKQLGIYEVPQNCTYLYCLQASIWNRKDLIKLYDLYKPKEDRRDLVHHFILFKNEFDRKQARRVWPLPLWAILAIVRNQREQR